MMPHPETLFDKAARGRLTPRERVGLEAHVRVCAVCRFERRVHAEFAIGLARDPEGALPEERSAS